MGKFIGRLTSTDDSDNAVTLNGGGILDWVYVSYVSSGDAGNRQLELRVKDAAGTVLYSVAAGAVQAASLTRTYLFAPGHARESAFVSGGITAPIPQIRIPDGGSIQIIDTAAIAATADDFTVRYQIGD